MRRKIEDARSLEEIFEIIADEIFNIKLINDDTHTLESKSNDNSIRGTFQNVCKKIYMRNSRTVAGVRYCEFEYEDMMQESFLLICEF